jgi:hypothetical protein
MAQSYRNCNARDLGVQFGYISGGAFTAETSCGIVPNGATVIIVRSSTITSGNYGSRAC